MEENYARCQRNEQKATIEALNNIANPEMTLAFIMAITTGTRLQTVFTLRRCHFEKMSPRKPVNYFYQSRYRHFSGY